ncbi:MAG: hypothetical protein ACOC0O_03495 [Spirochaetota bacterium]
MAGTYKDAERVIKTVLTEAGSMVSLEEIRAFMRQALARGEQLDANEREFLDLFADEFDPDEFDIDPVNRVVRGETE